MLTKRHSAKKEEEDMFYVQLPKPEILTNLLTKCNTNDRPAKCVAPSWLGLRVASKLCES